MAWTDERVETLRDLWNKGLSASQIAAELGEVTRNAVIGKAHRLGLSGRPKSGGANTSTRRAAPSRPQSPQFTTANTNYSGGAAAVSGAAMASGGGASAIAQGATARKIEEQIEEKPISEPVKLRVVEPAIEGQVTLLDLTERMCKWPIGDPGNEDFRFCGHAKQPGTSYCDDHTRMAYQPAYSRRRSR